MAHAAADVTRSVEVVVGLVGRAHGLRGEVSVLTSTDEPEVRFASGAVLRVEGTARTLTVVSSRWHSGALLVCFREAPDRTAAESLRGLSLAVLVDADARPAAPEEFYDRHLRGLRVLDHTGAEVGEVTDVVHLPAQDLLVVQTPAGERYVPFVAALVPDVDLAAGTCRLAAVEGLLDDPAAT